MNKSQLIVFNKRIKNNISILETQGNFLSAYINSSSPFSSSEWSISLVDELNESSSLISKYNSLNMDELPKVETVFISDHREMSSFKIDFVLSRLKAVLRELNEAADYLNLYLKPDLSDIEKSKIDFLRKELDVFREKECDLLIIENLKESLSEGESGHHLACGLISARIIDHIIQSIKKAESLPLDNLPENIVIRLRELGVLKKDDFANQDKKEFIDACKSSRDALSHNVEFMPKGSQSLSLLSYAFILVDIFLRYKDMKKK